MTTATSPDFTDTAFSRLTRGVLDLCTTDRWMEWLAMVNRFRTYSARNVLLIASQRPTATKVASYSTWKRLGRQVRRGEKALYIVAPLRPTQEDGEDTVPFGFRYVPVFDISQTEGDPLPAPCDVLAAPIGTDILEDACRIAAALGFTVTFQELGSETHGVCRPAAKSIEINARDTGTQQLKSLIHEISHAMLHASCPDRMRAEIEAESVAFIVMNHLGIDSSAYSFGYVATWGRGGDSALDVLRKSATTIRTAALFLCDQLDRGASQRSTRGATCA